MTVADKSSRKDLEQESFVDNVNSKTSRRVLSRLTFSSATTTNITVGTTATTLVSSNINRTVLWVSNFSNRAIAVRFLEATVDAAAFKGISIPGGESVKVIGDGEIYTGEVSVFGDGVNQEISFTEF